MLNPDLTGKNVAICVTGGIACYKICTLVSLLKKHSANVYVAMTENAAKFVSPLTFEALSHNAVVTDSFSRQTPYEVEHIAFAKRADIMVVAPATANIIAKAAHGIADDFISTTLLAAECKTIFVPAMNTAMYENQITQDNIEKLKKYNKTVLETAYGNLACGDTGAGKMIEAEEIFNYICSALLYNKKDFAGKKVLVTAGPTVERIDDVRYITNRSSGKMGYAVAKAAFLRGADVTLISGKTAISPHKGIKTIYVESAEDMRIKVEENFPDCDILIKAAAVADYTPEKKINGKIKKGGDMQLKLVRTADILASLCDKKEDRIVVGFAAEAADVLKNAQDKLKRKKLDIIAANDISRCDIGFGGEENALTLLFSDGRISNVEKCSKEAAANALLDAVLTLKNNND